MRHAAKGNFDKAEQSFRKALDIDADNTPIAKLIANPL